jgi:hypothetical protein
LLQVESEDKIRLAKEQILQKQKTDQEQGRVDSIVIPPFYTPIKPQPILFQQEFIVLPPPIPPVFDLAATQEILPAPEATPTRASRTPKNRRASSASVTPKAKRSTKETPSKVKAGSKPTTPRAQSAATPRATKQQSITQMVTPSQAAKRTR